MNPPTATPRTDAALYPMNGVEIVWPYFARQLETELERLRAEVERLKATLSAIEEDGTSEHNAAVGLRQNLVAAITRAEKAEAERDAFAKDKARLDWLSVSDAWFDYPATGAFTPDTMRAAIDAAIKGTP